VLQKEQRLSHVDRMLYRHLWRVVPGWMPSAHQSHSITPAPQLERKYNKRLVGWDNDKEKSLTNYHQEQNRFDLRENWF